MKNISKFGFALAVASAFSIGSSQAQAPLRQDQSVNSLEIVFRSFGDVTGAYPASDGTPVYVYGHGCPTGTSPILAPDGHPVTFGEWNDVQGSAAVKCIQPGSLVVVHLSGLIPNAQYSAWVVAFKAPGYDPTALNPIAANAITAGPLGAQDGSQNGFVSDDEGEGQITGILPPGPMSLIHLVPFDGCLTDYVEFQVHIAYHLDGMTHGPVQGPPCNWAVQRIFVFKP